MVYGKFLWYTVYQKNKKISLHSYQTWVPSIIQSEHPSEWRVLTCPIIRKFFLFNFN